MPARDAILRGRMKSVVLVTPHSLCTKDAPPGHWCDSASLPAALCVRDELNRRSGIADTHLVESYTPRYLCDLNRPQCRDRPFRKRIREIVDGEKRSGRDAMVLDVHSFPREGVDWGAGELVVLDVHPSTGTWYGYNVDLVRMLREGGIDAKLVKGSQMNDITVEFNAPPYEIVATLIEFDESSTDSKRKEICFIISDWVTSL